MTATARRAAPAAPTTAKAPAAAIPHVAAQVPVAFGTSVRGQDHTAPAGVPRPRRPATDTAATRRRGRRTAARRTARPEVRFARCRALR